MVRRKDRRGVEGGMIIMEDVSSKWERTTLYLAGKMVKEGKSRYERTGSYES